MSSACARTAARTCTSSRRSVSTWNSRQLRRAGLDYADLAQVTVHAGLDECLRSLGARAAVRDRDRRRARL